MTQGLTSFQTLSAILGLQFGHFGFSRHWGVQGGVALQALSECPQHR